MSGLRWWAVVACIIWSTRYNSRDMSIHKISNTLTPFVCDSSVLEYLPTTESQIIHMNVSRLPCILCQKILARSFSICIYIYTNVRILNTNVGFYIPQVTGIFWAPVLEGPLSIPEVCWTFDCTFSYSPCYLLGFSHSSYVVCRIFSVFLSQNVQEDVESYYEAYTCLATMFAESDLKVNVEHDSAAHLQWTIDFS